MSRWSRWLPVAAAAGLLGCGLGLLIDARAALAAYLTAWFAVSAVPFGAIAVLFTSYLVRAGWTHEMHRPLTAAALTTPVMAVLFLPVLLGMSWLYPWVTDTSGLIGFKATWLTPSFFVLRSVLYFLILTALAIWAAIAYGRNTAMIRSSSAGLIIWTLTASWAGIDWLESIEPHFHSSIYGLFVIDFQLLAGFAFGVVTLLLLRPARQMSNAAYSGTLLSLLLLWAYMHAMQYIIIWTGNIPDEVDWYLERLDHGWAAALWGMFIGQFIVPFFLLLSGRVRASTFALLSLAVATLAFRFLEAGLFVIPPLDVSMLALAISLPAAIVATGASFLLAWYWILPYSLRWSGRVSATSP